VKAITEDDDGNLWIGSDNGLSRLDLETNLFLNYRSDYKSPNMLPHSWVKALFLDKNNTLWVGTDGGVSKATIRKGEVIKFENYSKKPDNAMTDDRVKSLIVDRQGKVWIGTNNGLNILNPQDGTFSALRHNDENPYSLVNNYCKAILEDEQGIIWIGTEGGLSKFDANRFPFALYNKTSGIRDFSSDYVSAVLLARDGTLWVGTNDGVNNYNRDTGVTKTVTATQTHFISAIVQDKADNVWVGSDKGLFRFTSDGMKHYKPDGTDRRIPTEGILCLLNDRNKLLIGTWDGLSMYSTSSDTFTRLFQEELTGRIQALMIDAYGKLWIGTRSSLVRVEGTYDQNPTNLRYFRHEPANAESLSSHDINVLYMTPDRSIWIGTNGGGVNYFDPKKEAFVHFTIEDGLPSNNISAITSDSAGNLWISTDRGLCRMDRTTKIITLYEKSDGLQSNSFNLNSVFKAPDGELFFGGLRGMNSFYPDNLQPNDSKTLVYLTELQIFNKVVEPGQGILSKSVANESTIRLSHRDKILTLSFVGLNHRNPVKNKYSYKLEGFDEEWVVAPAERRYATYTNLNPGTYTFHVRATNNDGVWSPHEATLKIIIEPPFWATWWFSALMAVLIISLLFLFIRLRTQSLEHAKVRLESEVSLRTRELQQEKESLQVAYEQISDQRDEIEAQKELIDQERRNLEEAQQVIKKQNEELQTSNVTLEHNVKERTKELKETIEKMVLANNELDFFVYRAAHDLRGPIARMEGLCHVGLLEEDKAEAYKYLQKVQGVSAEMNNMLSRLLRTRTLNRQQIRARDLNLNYIIKKIIASCSISAGKHVTVEVSIPDNIIVSTDPELLDILLENVIQNAFQYIDSSKPTSYVRVTARDGESAVVISVEDNGIGIPEDMKDQVFAMFFKATEQSNGFGLGLYEANLISKKLNGKIYINLHRKEGTEMMIELPVKHVPSFTEA
jgi:ligand-binding sensor domain-containing protein/signal transduction histidine kinase